MTDLPTGFLVMPNLGNPGHDCTQRGNEDRPEPSYYPPISEPS